MIAFTFTVLYLCLFHVQLKDKHHIDVVAEYTRYIQMSSNWNHSICSLQFTIPQAISLKRHGAKASQLAQYFERPIYTALRNAFQYFCIRNKKRVGLRLIFDFFYI